MNTILIAISVISALIANYVLFLVAWLAKKNEFKTYKEKLKDFEDSKQRIKEEIDNDRKKFE